MPDPITRKRLKKKMLDRWENEGGSIATDTTTSDVSSPTSEDKDRRGKLSPSDNSTAGVPAVPTKRRKSTRK